MKKRIRKFAYVACNGGEHNHDCQYGCIGCGACVEACRKNAVSINAQGVAEMIVTIAWAVGCAKKPVRSRSSTCTMWVKRFWYAAPTVIWEHRREMPVM